jgi:type VI secretion system protein
MQALTSSLDEGLRDRAVSLLRERYPALGGGGEGSAPSGPTPVATPMAEPANGLGATALKLVQAFAESYLPMAQAISTPQAVESFLGRIAELIESYSKSFVELRKGYNEFGKEMGIRTVHGDTPIHRARDHRQVLAYLLEGRDDGQRIQDPQAAFADIMIHHVALLNGIMEGAREMLGRLSPDEVVAEAMRQPVRPWPPSTWPIGKGRFWNTYVGRHREIADEESSISQVLFGKEFARAYSAVVGQRGAAPEPPDEDEPTSRRALPRNSAGPRTSHGR